MRKVTFIGAGSTVFARRLIWELTGFPEFQECEIALMDIAPDRLDLISRFVNKYVEHHKLKIKVTATLQREEAVKNADYVFVCIHPGGDEAAMVDIEIPERYGITQPVGDTLGPGGIFRALRTMPAMVEIARDMERLAPGALMLQLSNPMAINTWTVHETTDIPLVGLCHGGEWQRTALAPFFVGGTPGWEHIPAEWGDIPRVTYRTAGINHMAWYMNIRFEGEEKADEVFRTVDKDLGPHFKHDWFRVETWRRFGRFLTESSAHHSEYVAFYRKHGDLVEKHCPAEAIRESLEKALNRDDGASGEIGSRKSRKEQLVDRDRRYRATLERQIVNIGKDHSPDGILPGTWTPEAGAKILRAIETNRPFRFHGNVKNEGHITNLPDGCCVEVPCFADEFGISSMHVGKLPTQCAALCRTNINVQELVVEAGLTRSRERARQALLLDPLTSSLISPEQTWKMADEMFARQEEWLSYLKD